MSNFENTITASHQDLIRAVNNNLKSMNIGNNYQAIHNLINEVDFAELYNSTAKIVEAVQSTYSSLQPTISQLSEIAAKQSAFVEQVASLQNSYIQMFQSSYFYQIQETLQSISGMITSQNLVINQTLLNISSVIDDISLEDIQAIEKNVEHQDTYESGSINVREYIYDYVDESIKSNGVTELSEIFDDSMTDNITHNHDPRDDNDKSEHDNNQWFASSINFFHGEIQSEVVRLIAYGIIKDLTDEGFFILLLIIYGALISLRNLKD